ncbi:outer membrane protein insertion porin family [Altererythrobacter atlanticus]|uniref:Outer membrane protein assembly factor BamA n=1 Tax=Croceibacterium atlanticum TaxID=1267766 RepID=A0A0F7KMW8_9SPHN|nr:outer membrane protein assembly factor BamA [Croceibacterium atlanticum]AKH41883.1 Outer membrane protein assembly factor BamA precursor [Croceibacterium atlanticum]MBB5733554.1 outer membrane protein insertion porin family [Croceibacterium atlanticum]
MSVRAKTKNASHFAAGLLGCTMLAGLPASAYAQNIPEEGQEAAQQPAPAPTPAPATPPEQQGQVIRTIAVAGSQRLEPETIVSYIQLRAGDLYTPAAADQALKDLAATELFSDYRIENNDGNVVITIVENPVINRIVLEGNKRLKDDKILPEIQLSARQIFTRSKVRADVARIIELYKRQGRFAATVEPQMVQLDQNRVDVVFEITEGPKSKVRKINIIGNDEFSDGDLKGEMVTKEAGLLKIFSSGTSYDPDRLAFDQQQLRAFYLENGYADFRVVSAVAELTPDKKDFIITYVVEEGERYKFGDVEVDSQLRDFDSDRMTRSLPMKAGDWYDAKLVEDTVESLSETAGAFGYAFADVQPDFSRSREDLTMGVTFVIREAPRVYIESVDVNGNTLTQDKVIRREFRLAEGDAFNSLQVKRSTARINSLGYFQENFEISQVEGSAPDRIVLEANVEEQATGELSLSAGFSSLESFIFQGSIRQRNFRGRGQTVGLSLSYSSYSRSGSISFTEPYLFDKNISAGIDIYRRDYNNGYYNRRSATYESATTGFQARVGVPLTEYMSVLGRYTFNYDDITIDENSYFADLDGDGVRTCEPLLAGRYLCEAIGTRTSSILGMSLVYRNLDSVVRPTRGESAQIGVDFAGLGGNTRYLRFSAQAAKYWSLGSGFIFSLTGETGLIQGLKDRGEGQDDVLLTDRFFLGEPQIRGFDIRGVGPRVIRRFYGQNEDGEVVLQPYDANNNYDDALGGKAMYLAKAELEIPLGSGAREMGLRPSIFLDAGAVYNITDPVLVNSPYPDGLFIPRRDADGNALYYQNIYDNDGQITGTTIVTSPLDPDGEENTAIGNTISPFVEEFVGDTWKPRVAIGIGVNWNSPFGPFRINFAYPLLKQEGDDTKKFSFNVGTQF